MSYRPNFSSAWAKVYRAKRHRDAFKSAIDTAFVKPGNRVEVVTKFNPKTGKYEGRIKRLPTPLFYEWATILGDFIHNARAALDHAIWQAILLKSDGVWPVNWHRMGFPISDTFAELKRTLAWKAIEPSQRAVVRMIQPYRRPYGPEIRWLREASNADKHRSLNFVLFKTGNFDRLPPDIGALTDFEIDRPLKVGTKVYELTPILRKPDPSIEVHSRLTPRVALPYKGTVMGRPDMTLDAVRFIVKSLEKSL